MADRRPLVLAGWLGAAAVLLAPGLGAAGRALAAEPAVRLELPAPTRPAAVGDRDTFLADPSRSESATGAVRTLPIRGWYPAADRGRGRPTPYLSPATQPLVVG